MSLCAGTVGQPVCAISSACEARLQGAASLQNADPRPAQPCAAASHSSTFVSRTEAWPEDLPWSHLLRFLSLAEIANLRLVCTTLQLATDHHVECIEVREEKGVDELLAAYHAKRAAAAHNSSCSSIAGCSCANNTCMGGSCGCHGLLDGLVSCMSVPALHWFSTERLTSTEHAATRPSLLSRLWHLKRVTYHPSGRPGSGGEATMLHFVGACLEATHGRLTELQYDVQDVITASSRSSQQLRLSSSALMSLIAAHPRGWRLLDLPICLAAGAAATAAAKAALPTVAMPAAASSMLFAPPNMDSKSRPATEAMGSDLPAPGSPTAAGVGDTSMAAQANGTLTIDASPLATFLSSLPPSLTSLTLQLASPHIAFTQPATHLGHVTHLCINNYAGWAPEHAWILVSGMPSLRSLELSWPILAASQGNRPIPAIATTAPILSSATAAAFAAWQARLQARFQDEQQQLQQQQPAATNSAVSKQLPSSSFWGLLGCLPKLRSLRLELDAAAVPLTDLPNQLTQLHHLHIAMHREHQLPPSFLRELVSMPYLTSLSLAQVSFHMAQDTHENTAPQDSMSTWADKGILADGRPAGVHHRAAAAAAPCLNSLCLHRMLNAAISAVLVALGPAHQLRRLHVASPDGRMGTHHAWARLLPRMGRLESLTVENMWQLDDAALIAWSTDVADNVCDTVADKVAQELTLVGRTAGCDSSAAAQGHPGRTACLASRLSHLGILSSGCTASPAAMCTFAAACTRLGSLRLGLIATKLINSDSCCTDALAAWLKQRRLTQVVLPEKLLSSCRGHVLSLHASLQEQQRPACSTGSESVGGRLSVHSAHGNECCCSGGFAAKSALAVHPSAMGNCMDV